ncbi:MAG TPA: hypothetical protein VN885_04975 [Candidatus Acidoferrales bacterium]|nr:hypothetical protein [Candidatus Acidoferrales bacterium]
MQKKLCISVEAVENSPGPSLCIAENIGRHSGRRMRGDGFTKTLPGWQRYVERISSATRSKSRPSSRIAAGRFEGADDPIARGGHEREEFVCGGFEREAVLVRHRSSRTHSGGLAHLDRFADHVAAGVVVRRAARDPGEA